jgi:hypothetical protein
MKKIKTVFSVLGLLAILVLIGYYGLVNQREKRLWPFNSKLSGILPPAVKHYAYMYTSPNQNTITSFLYNIKIKYYQIPDSGAVGGGGAINNIGNNKFLVTLNNGQSLVFDERTGVFNPIISDQVMKIFSSIRDVFVFENGGNKYIAFLGTTNQTNGCKRISVYLAKYVVSESDLNLTNAEPIKLWETENACSSPIDNNAGGRILFKGGKFYVSTGFFMGSGSFGDTPDFSQRNESFFGKVIEINLQGDAQVISSGHRNPEGLFFAKSGSVLFSTEHAMRGGDELNIIRKSANYGFPCESYGTPYGYEFSAPQKDVKFSATDTSCTSKKLEDPNFYWTDTTGISQGIEYFGEEFHAYKGNLLIGSLSGTSLFRIQLGMQNNVMFVERINLHERVRDLNISDTGKILIMTDGGNILVLSADK